MRLSEVLGRRRQELRWLEVHWPQELAPEAALALLRQLATDHLIRLAAFEVDSVGGQLVYRVGAPKPALARLKALLQALVPGVSLSRAADRTPFPSAWRVEISTRHRSLAHDPQPVVRAILASLSNCRSGERAAVQWLLGPAHAPAHVSESTPSSAVQSWWQPLLSGNGEPLDAERRRALALKRGDHAFACLGRVAVQADGRERTRALAVGVLAGLRLAETPGVRVGLIREESERFHRPAVPWRWSSTLNALELLGLLGWPTGSEPLPGVARDQARVLRADARLEDRRRVVGVSTAPGESRELSLSIDDARQHLHALGPTGVGKSTLLAGLICQDIAAGRGVVAIDPKGDLITDVLERIPASRAADVVVIDPAEGVMPVGLNPLDPRGRRPELVADQVLAVFHGLYQHNWGPRLQDILHASLLSLAARPGASLCVLPALLTNPGVRRRLLAGVDDPIALGPFWAWFENISEAERQQAVAPVLNKLRPFLLRRSVRAIVGQVEPRFRMEEVFTRRRIVLVSLAKGLIGPEASALLGALVVAQLWQAVLGRAAIEPRRRTPVSVFADEFQDYVHLPTDLADALAQARGLGVGLTLAHQHLAQLPPGLRSAVLANARSRVCFNLSGEDAQTIARLSGGQLRSEDLQRLRRFEAYASLVSGSEPTGYASIRTLPLPDPISDPASIREASRRSFGRPVDEVEAAIAALIGGDEDPDERLHSRARSEK